MPLGIALVRRKFEYLHRMAIRVFEVKGFDASGVLVPVGKSLWAGGGVLHVVLPKDGIRTVHVTNDDGDVLKPQIVAARIHRDGSPPWSEKLREFDGLIA